MKTDFMIALTQLAAERNLPKEIILKTIESTLVSIFKKGSFATDQEIRVKMSPKTGEVKVYSQKTVVKRLTGSSQEISLSQAKKIKGDIQIGDTIEIESTPENAGRIAAQAAKQVISQRLREVERDTIFGQYANKEGEVVSGVVHYLEPKQVFVDLGKAESILPLAEQVNTERYRIGQRLKLYLMKVLRTDKGTQLIVSRTHPNLLRRLFELEVPEIYNGTVELKALAREPGHRSKIAVFTKRDGVDAIGCCVGLRSIRIQNITRELNDEKIDIVQWHPDPAVFITNALKPASVAKVEINEEEKSANVIVHDKQLSLAIGKGGENARLTARLTGWRIDIKSLSMIEAERAEKAEKIEEVVSAESAVEPAAEVIPEPVTEEIPPIPGKKAKKAVKVKEIVPAEAIAEPAVEIVSGPIEEEIAPIPEEVKEPVSATTKRKTPAVAKPSQPSRTYSVEEILSEIETATESLQVQFSGKKAAAKSVQPDTKVRKGKEKILPEAEIPAGKPKPKKALRRFSIQDDEDDTEDSDEEIFSEIDADTQSSEKDSSEDKPEEKSTPRSVKSDTMVKGGKGKSPYKGEMASGKTKQKKTPRRFIITDDEEDTD